MPLQVTHEPPHRKVNPFVFHTRAVVVYERFAKHRHERIVAKATLHDPFGYMHALYVPRFAAFHKIKLVKTAAFVCSVMQGVESVVDVLQGVRFIALRACFPPDTSATLFEGAIKVVKRKYFVKVAVLLVSLPLAPQAFFFSALIPRLVPFLAVHFDRKYPVQSYYRCGVWIARSTNH